MKITDTNDYIRQQQIGQFTRLQDPNDPFVYVNNQKLDSTEEKEKSSIYINNENVVTLEKEKSSNFPKLFDFDAGMKFNTKKISKSNNEEKPNLQYDKTAKTQIGSKQERLIDQFS